MKKGEIDIGKRTKKTIVVYGNKETMEHLIGDCSGMTRTIKAVAEILRSSGEGVEWVREIINRRRQCENVVRL